MSIDVFMHGVMAYARLKCCAFSFNTSFLFQSVLANDIEENKSLFSKVGPMLLEYELQG